jgi:hypothetical protein
LETEFPKKWKLGLPLETEFPKNKIIGLPLETEFPKNKIIHMKFSKFFKKNKMRSDLRKVGTSQGNKMSPDMETEFSKRSTPPKE